MASTSSKVTSIESDAANGDVLSSIAFRLERRAFVQEAPGDYRRGVQDAIAAIRAEIAQAEAVPSPDSVIRRVA